jgi:hypothetical protein
MPRHEHELPAPTYCPYCGYLNQCATCPGDDDARPSDGTPSICIRCGEWSLFDANMLLRRPTMAEFVTITRTCGRQIEAFRRALREVHATKGMPTGPSNDN